MNKKTILISTILGVLVVGGIAFYLQSRSKKKKASDGNTLKSADAEPIATEPIAIRSDLKWISNPKTAAYLGTILQEGKGTALRGWVELIKKERAADPSKWGDANGLTGEASDIGHGLYQMSNQGTHGFTWSNDVRFGLIDNQ